MERGPVIAEDFGVYVHFPFCRNRCGYCDFQTSAPGEIPHQSYADAVLAELRRRSLPLPSGALCAIYIGGGTPSLWQGRHLARVISQVRQRFRSTSTPEITVEANPGTLDQEGLAVLVECGINRISLGVQSLDDSDLALLGRSHTAAQVRAVVGWIRAAGVENLGCDIIFGLPGQTLEHYLDQLRRLLDLRPDHISAYNLTLAPGTPMARAGQRPVDADLAAEMMEQGRDLLAAAGYPQYEVSNYASQERRSVQNSLVWAGRPFLGLGAHAHSTFHSGAHTVHLANPGKAQYLDAWLGRGDPPPAHWALMERLGARQSREEVLFLGLRTVDGVDRRRYGDRFGGDLMDHYGSPLREMQIQGLLKVEPGQVRPTPRGILFADEIALRLMSA